MSNIKDLNLFFPLYELSPQGWLNDFISSQVTRDKDGIAYSMLYKDYDYCKSDVKTAIKTALDKKNDKIFKEYSESNSSQKNPNKFFYVNGAYADKLENNILVKADAGASFKDYVLKLNSIKPFQLAFFQPYMKLYYGWKKPEETNYQWIEFPFSQKFDLDTILNPADNSFLEGSGIKSISNSQQFNVGIKVNAELTISYFFSNMSILTQKRDTGYEMPYGFSFTKVMSNLGVDVESLKLEYGYQIDPNLFSEHQINPALCELINQKEKKEFLLLKTSHNFSFSKEGNVEITVNYKNRFEGDKYRENTVCLPSKSNPANVRIFDKTDVSNAGIDSLMVRIEELKAQEKLLNQEIKNTTLKSYDQGVVKGKNTDQTKKSINLQKQKQIETLKNKLKDVSSALISTKRQVLPYFKDVLLQKIKDNLNLFSITFNTKKNKNSKTYTINSKLHLLSRSNENVFITDLTNKTYDINDFLRGNPANFNNANAKMETVLNRIFNTPTSTTNTDKEFGHIVFFPVKALIRAAYEMLSTEEQNKVPAYLFGNLSSRVFDDLYYINAGHVLIEVKTFQKWLYEKFFSRNSVDFSLGELIDQVIEDLVPEALYRQRTYPQTNTRLTIQDYAFCSLKDENSLKYLVKIKNDLEHGEKNQATINEVLSTVTRYKTDGIPFIIYSKMDIPSIQETTSCSFNVNTTNDLNLNEEQDAINGIPHLVIGSDGGMFLSADFSQIDLKGLRTGVALQSLTDQNSSNFFYYYNLSAQVVGSSVFNFGSFICIPTPPLGFKGGEYDIGVVGYYKVKDLKDSLTPGSYKSTVSGDWFWNPRLGKDGNLPDSNVTVAKKPSDIKDYINVNTLTAESYVKYLFDKDVTTVVNIGGEKKETGKAKDKEAKKQKTPTKKSPDESKEKDVS